MRSFASAGLSIALCAACADNTVVVTPIIDIPVNDDAQALTLSSITLSVAHAGAADDISSQTFVHGDVVELPGIPFGDDLVVHMTGRIGTSEEGYGRTCEFSVRPDDARIISPHLFFSKNVKFGELSQQPLPRQGGTALMYRDGSGLLIGGTFPDENMQPVALTQIERFDPTGGDYDNLHDIERRYDAAVAVLGTGTDSRMVIVGGKDPNTGVGAGYVEVIEAERNTDRQYEKFDATAMKRFGLTATTLTDGRVVVIGGRCGQQDPVTGDCPSENAFPNAVQLITVTTGTTAVTESHAKLTHIRYGHTATRLTEELGAAVLVAGGRDPRTDMPVKEAELFKPLADAFSDKFTAQMLYPRWGHQAVRLPDGSVLFIGGLTKVMVGTELQTQVVNRLELFSPLDATFVDVGPLPDEAGHIGMSATVLPDGRVLITGGQVTIGGPPVNRAYIANVDPINGEVRVVDTDRLAVPRTNHQATPLCDGTILISGGTDGQAPYERYNPVATGRR